MAADLWTLHLALANNMTEDEFRRTEPAVYQRLQSRYLTQAEMTRDRLNQLLFGRLLSPPSAPVRCPTCRTRQGSGFLGTDSRFAAQCRT